MRLGPKTGCGYALRGQLQQFVKDGVPYSIGRPRGLGPRGKALSSAAISASLSVRLSGSGVVRGVLRARRLRNREHRWRAREKRQRDLTRRCLVRIRNRLQHLAALAARGRKIIMAERRIGDDGDTVLLAPRDHRVLDGAFLQMIEHLVTGDLALARDIEQFVEIVAIEIADAPRTDLPGSAPVRRMPPPSPRTDRSRASAADSNRDDRSSAASANARRR